MEFMLYLLSNWLVTGGGVYLLHAMHNGQLFKPDFFDGTKRELLISFDMQVMLFIGSIARVYWSFSPPTVYNNENYLIQLLSIFDICVSPILWGLVLAVVGLNQKKYTSNETPVHFRWYSIAGASLVLGWVWAFMLPKSPFSFMDAAFPCHDTVVMFNMIGDGLAIVPQLHLTRTSKESATPEASHFVGLLSVGRACRVVFWLFVILAHWFRGQGFGDAHIWSFIIPDILHSYIMFDYALVWAKKVKHDQMKTWGMVSTV